MSNGSLLRLAPVPMRYARDPIVALERSGESLRAMRGAQTGPGKDDLLSSRYAPVLRYWLDHPLHPAIEESARGSFKRKQPPAINGTGYVVNSLEAALWSFYRSNSFREGCLLAVNLGDDADTTSAIYGQLAGTYYGGATIPIEWWEKLAKRELIESFADRLFHLAVAA